ncbi:hypothetical protein RA279_27870, partial [Pseudomonas syringae pv. tagetis]|uniref:hypothetical protein n=1 Tax=Pseudomonas syringae group genomosp. 7 TaxID=251699 RepID=UPI00377014C5
FVVWCWGCWFFLLCCGFLVFGVLGFCWGGLGCFCWLCCFCVVLLWLWCLWWWVCCWLVWGWVVVGVGGCLWLVLFGLVWGVGGFGWWCGVCLWGLFVGGWGVVDVLVVVAGGKIFLGVVSGWLGFCQCTFEVFGGGHIFASLED